MGLTIHRVSASNSAKLYEMALSNHEYLVRGEWQFISQLNTDHVWDSIIILALLRDKESNNSHLEVPHEGKQKDRFTLAMEERNKRIIHEGQPNAVHHACDKCLRIYADEEGVVHAFYHCQTTGKLFLTDLFQRNVSGHCWRWTQHGSSLLWCLSLYRATTKQPT